MDRVAWLGGANRAVWGTLVKHEERKKRSTGGVVDLSSGDFLQNIDAHEGPILATLPWQNGTEIVSGGTDHLIRRWESANGNLIKQFSGHGARITDLAKVDERHFLSSSDDGTIRLWDSETGDERARFEGHDKQVTCIEVLPAGEYFVSGGDDRTVRLWKIPSLTN